MNPVEYVAGQFGNPRGWGGRLSTFVMNRMNRAQYRGAEKSLGLTDGETVLDVGFGNGYLLERLAEKYSCRLYGVEVSNDMLRAARERCKRYIENGRMELLKGSAGELPFPDNAIDKVYTVNTVYFWPDLGEGMEEVFRVLRPGGVFVNAFYSKQWLDGLRYTRYGFAKYKPEELAVAARLAGFTCALVELKPDCAYCLVSQKPM